MQSNWDDLSEISLRNKRNWARTKYGHRLVAIYNDEHFLLIPRVLPTQILAVTEAIREFDERN